MRAKSLAIVVAIAAGTVLPAAAQEHDPVPTRIRYEYYGAPSGTPSAPALDLRLDPAGDATSQVIVSGGHEGDLGCTIVGTAAADLALPFDARGYVLPDIAVIPGRFDQDRQLRLPVALLDRSLVGQSVYFQGLNLGPTTDPKPAMVVFQLSRALRVTWSAGNEQPANVHWDGPPLFAVPLNEVTTELVPSYTVLARVIAPTSSYALVYDGMHMGEAATAVYLTLREPALGGTVIPEQMTLRVLAPVGAVPSDRIHVYVQITREGQPKPPVYDLAAVIDTSY